MQYHSGAQAVVGPHIAHEIGGQTHSYHARRSRLREKNRQKVTKSRGKNTRAHRGGELVFIFIVVENISKHFKGTAQNRTKISGKTHPGGICASKKYKLENISKQKNSHLAIHSKNICARFHLYNVVISCCGPPHFQEFYCSIQFPILGPRHRQIERIEFLH